MSFPFRSRLAAAPVLFLLLFGFASAAARAADWTWQNPLPQGNTLLDVWGSSGSNVFAVGDSGAILHYDGVSWSAMSSGTTNSLLGVWGSSGSDVLLGGCLGDDPAFGRPRLVDDEQRHERAPVGRVGHWREQRLRGG